MKPALHKLFLWAAVGAVFPPGQGLLIPAPLFAATASGDSANNAPQKWWSFKPVRNPSIPVVKDSAWSENPVDRFLLAKLEQQGVKPAPPADRRTLIRRATFDLTGLPPTPEEIAAFAADSSTNAFVKVIDRLLDSPHYGEQWGRHWLDVVRYADTAGDTADYPVGLAWRYRNYVIGAFNADKPYDEFVREQVAGDILAGEGPRERYAERVTATGFLAISRRFGFDSENYQHLTIQDTLDTLGQTVLGLSLGCARCHDHKFDPISMKDYYAMYGIFASSRYAFPGSEQKGKLRAMVPLLPIEESQPKWREYDQRVAALSESIARQKKPVPPAVYRSLHDPDGDFEIQKDAAGGSYGAIVPPWLGEGKLSVTTGAQSPFKNLYPSGRFGANIAGGDEDYRLEQALYPRRTRKTCPVLHVNLDFRTAPPDARVKGLHRFWIGSFEGAPAIEVLISSEAVYTRAGNELEKLTVLKPHEWHNLQLTLDLESRTFSGSLGRPDGVTTFSNRRFVPDWPGTIDHVALDSQARAGGKLPVLEIDNFGAQPAPIAAVTTNPPALAPGGEVAKEIKDLTNLLVEGPCEMTYGVVEGTPHNEPLQKRGQPDRPGAVIPRGFIQVLGGGALPEGTAGSGRLEMARWLTSPDNPLTARVMVNRIWQYHFGHGLVATPNDFGARGHPPTHPELLDYLASRFMQSGWSVKAMHRLIMSSAAYQEGGQNLATSDPAITVSNKSTGAPPPLEAPNAEYSFFAGRRLNAEEIRDSILAVSGDLDETPGREHPFPSPVTSSYSQHAPFSAVYENNRRSVYLMTQRLKRHPFLALFDGPDPNTSTPERPVTTVPTQALFFLNSPFVHAKSASCARRLTAACGSESQRIEMAWRLTVGRPPTETERTEAAAFLADYRAELGALGQTGVEPAALAAYVRTLFASNEFLHLD